MKRIILIILSGIIMCPTMAVSNELASKDTVTIEFGTTSKMVIIAETPQDLKALQDYDINGMIGQLNAEIDSIGTGVSELGIYDETGTLFLKDTVKEQHTSPFNERLQYYGESENTTKSYSSSSNFGSPGKDYKYKESKTKGAFEFQFGMNNWLEKGNFPDQYDAPYSVKPWGSWYFSMGANNRTHIVGPVVLNWGADISWYAFKMENRSVRITKDSLETTFVEDPNVIGIKSKLGIAYLNASVVPMLDFGYGKNKRNGRGYGTFKKYGSDGFRIGLGGYVGYRIDSWTKFVYEQDGDKNKDKIKSNYFLENFRYGLRGLIGFRGMNFFANYDLNEVIAEGRGPKLNAISFGIIF